MGIDTIHYVRDESNKVHASYSIPAEFPGVWEKELTSPLDLELFTIATVAVGIYLIMIILNVLLWGLGVIG